MANSPINTKAMDTSHISSIPFPAARFTPCLSPSPSFLDNTELTPTPSPIPMPTARYWTGIQREIAVNAESPSLATYILSTSPYKTCTSMEMISGRDIFLKSFPMGSVPISFSAAVSSPAFLLNSAVTVFSAIYRPP